MFVFLFPLLYYLLYQHDFDPPKKIRKFIIVELSSCQAIVFIVVYLKTSDANIINFFSFN